VSIKDNESERRRRVAEEKAWGAIIESIERTRKNPVARSVALRIFYLYNSLYKFADVCKEMGKKSDPLKTIVPSFTEEQTNFLIKTYNHIIDDFHSNFKKKDSLVDKFSPFNKLEQSPTINDVSKILFMMAINLVQMLCYLIRWIDNTTLSTD